MKLITFFPYILVKIIEIVTKRKTKYVCQECGFESLRWLGKCTQCNNWNTFVEEVTQPKGVHKSVMNVSKSAKPMEIKKIDSSKEKRMTTEMKEFNRVLGGGIVLGSLILIGGDRSEERRVGKHREDKSKQDNDIE